ncbi:MAG: OmpA family protein [Sphingobacteriaceae bacterium]|nr:OmpA family protein [Sphingobacteriaceae bacterium]
MKIHNYKLLMVAMFATIATVAQAQNKSAYQQPNKWTIGLTTGLTAPFHDVRPSEYGEPSDLSYNLGGHLTYWMSPALGLRTQVSYGNVNGKIRQNAYLNRLNFTGPVTSSTVYYEGLLQGVINFSALGLKGYKVEPFERKFNVFATLGLGLTNFYAKMKDANGDFINTVDFGRASGTSFVLPIGLGMAYKISPKFHLEFDLNLRNINSDAFDGLVVQKASGSGTNEPNFGRNLDKFATVNVSFVMHLGKNRQGNSNVWASSYSQQQYAELSEDLNKFESRVREQGRKNQEQDLSIVALEEKIALLERQLRSSEVEMKKDSDGDGVPDVFDKEFTKWDLTGLMPSPCGWSEEELSTLRIRARNNEKILVDGSGIALDVDKDGIPDHLDKCPTIPGIAACGGCKLEPKPETMKILTDLQSIEFESGLSDFVDCSRKRTKALQEECKIKQDKDVLNLQNLALYLNESTNMTFKLRITGHTDDVGAAETNQVLSEDRAKSVRDRLVSMGVASSRIIVEGKGEEEPKFGPSGTNGQFTTADRNRNRRIELVIE